jgi:hypothetical protein
VIALHAHHPDNPDRPACQPLLVVVDGAVGVGFALSAEMVTCERCAHLLSQGAARIVYGSVPSVGPKTLPAGWTGNRADHHAQVGPFLVEVYRIGKRLDRWRWRVKLGHVLVLNSDPAGHPTPDEARKVGRGRLRGLAAEVFDALGGE